MSARADACRSEHTVILPEVGVAWLGEGRVIIALRGEHDLATSEEMRALLDVLVRENELVVIDLSGAEFIDSSVLNNLMRAHRGARERGSTVRLQLGGAAIVRKVLEIGGLLDHLDCVDTREQALLRR